jgi:hypothetical protein
LLTSFLRHGAKIFVRPGLPAHRGYPAVIQVLALIDTDKAEKPFAKLVEFRKNPFDWQKFLIGYSGWGLAWRARSTAALARLRIPRRIVPGEKRTARERFFSKAGIYHWKADSNTETNSPVAE